jgi:hypothetical protein
MGLLFAVPGQFFWWVVAYLVSNPTIPSDFVLRGSWGTLPGDVFEQAEADDEAEGGGEEDGPGVGGEAEEWAGAWGGHVRSPGRMRCGHDGRVRGPLNLDKGYGAGGTSYNNSVWA